MKAVLQRVTHASVVVEGKAIAQIGPGLLVLLGVGRTDTEEDARYIARKIPDIRIFSDPEGKTNLALSDIGGSVLLVSQFTLYADTRKGRRPSFIEAAPPDLAQSLVDRCAQLLHAADVPVQTGRFAAHMQITLLNDGPFTILLDTAHR